MARKSDRRRRRRLWAALLLLLASVMLAVGTGGFSAVSADRGVDAAVVPDDEAYLGVNLTVVDEGGSGRKAISFVGFCTAEDVPLDASANVTRYKAEVDRSNADSEALAVAWAANRSVSTVVLKTGGGSNAIEDFPGGTTGTAAVGDGTPAGEDRSPNEYCPDGEFEAGKLEADDGDLGIAPDATPVGGEGLEVRITNRFNTDLTELRVTVGDETKTLADGDAGAALDPGESVALEFETCDDPVAIKASGDGVSVELERSCP